MKRKIRFVQYGCGKMSRYLMRYAIGKGAELQAAFDTNPDITGKDVSEIIGNGFPATGISVSPAEKAGALIKELKPDVCIIATRSTVAELEDIFTICAKNGVNAITTCEEALYPWNSSPELTARLDKLAKEGGCTLTGVGYCDLLWGTMVTNLAGSSFKITTINGSSWYNVEDYGIALAEGHGVLHHSLHCLRSHNLHPLPVHSHRNHSLQNYRFPPAHNSHPKHQNQNRYPTIWDYRR